MSLQWNVIGGFLYAELGVILLMMLPFISATSWQRLFKSGMAQAVANYANYYFTIFLVLLGICFADSIREINKYDQSDQVDVNLANNPNSVDHMHMKLFRAQRNFYIAGFAVFLWFVLRRLVTLLSTEATLLASKEAAIKQAKSASEAAQRLMADQSQGDEALNDKNEAAELKKKLKETKDTLKTRDADLEAIKKQAESTNREYDRLSTEYQKLQQQVDGSEDKKSS